MSGPTLTIEATALTLQLGDDAPLVLSLSVTPVVLALDTTISIKGDRGASGVGALTALTADAAIAAESGHGYTNEGATGPVVATLPAISALTAGERFVLAFFSVAAQTFRIQAQGSDVIHYSGVASPSLEIADVDGVILLERIAAGVWLVTQAIREWSIG